MIDQVEMSEAPRISLGGRTWPLPKLAARQIKRVVPMILGMNGIDWANISEDEVEHLYKLCYTALTRGTPNLTREEFDDLPITIVECAAAIPAITAAAGMVSVDPNRSPAPAEE